MQDPTREEEQHLERLEAITEWLDRRYLDPLIGFVFPGVGDVATSLVGLYGVYVAGQLKTHPVIIARMLLNLGLDAFLGVLPLIGIVLDVVFRAHEQNLILLKERTQRGDPTPSDWLLVLGAFALLLFVGVVVPLTLVGFITYWILGLVTQ